jgi:hypothetical protein
MLALALPIDLLIGLSLGALGGGCSILTVPALVYLLAQDTHAAMTGSVLIVGVTALAAMAAPAEFMTTQIPGPTTPRWTCCASKGAEPSQGPIVVSLPPNGHRGFGDSVNLAPEVLRLRDDPQRVAPAEVDEVVRLVETGQLEPCTAADQRFAEVDGRSPQQVPDDELLSVRAEGGVSGGDVALVDL